MAATRLRKTFHYPDSSDDEDMVESGMDAQDQETLLTTLQTRDTSSTRTYTLLLIILPASIALLTVPRLLSISTFLPSLLAVASFAASAYTLYFLPLPPQSPEIIVDGQKATKGKGRSKGGYGLNTHTSSLQQDERKRVPWLSDEVQELLAQYMVPGNGVICGLLALLELVQGREWRGGMMVGGGYLPGLVLTVVLWARRELRVVDMSELHQLRSRS